MAGGLNPNAALNNSPHNYRDSSGHSPTFIAGAVGAVVGGIWGGIDAYMNDRNFFAGVGKGALLGGIMGLTGGLASSAATAVFGGSVATGLIGVGVGKVVGNAVGAAAGDAIGQGVNILAGEQTSFSWQQLAGATATGTLLGPLSVGVGRTVGASTLAKGAFRPLVISAGGAASGAAGNAMSQGINLATGVQDGFDVNQFGLAAGMGAVGGLIGNYAGLFERTCFRAGTPMLWEITS